MTPTDKLAAFIERMTQRPLPQNAMARARLLAREFAEGAADGVWSATISHFRGGINHKEVILYLLCRWQGMALSEAFPFWEANDLSVISERIWLGGGTPGLDLLVSNGYLEFGNNIYQITKAAFDLIEETEPANIFISYRRKDSSAFALLVLARLKAEGLEPFLDLALVPGEDWRAGLRERIHKYDYFIALIGAETLTSEVVIEEIAWALEAKLTIIPIWHNGFSYKSDDWRSLPPAVDEALRMRHTIRVLEENPLSYNNAIVELLNRFGVTP